MEQVAEGLYRLGRKHHNFYLLAEGGRVTVVDAGGSRELPLLEAALTALGLTLDSVEALLITHAHTDHIGFARLVEKRGISVRVHEDEAAYAMDGSAGSQIGMMDVPLWKPRVIAFMAEMMRVGADRGYRLTNVETLVDGDRLDLPGKPLVVATPGHTAGHASYLFPVRRALCSGDVLVTDGLVRSGSGPQMLPDVFHYNAAMARESLVGCPVSRPSCCYQATGPLGAARWRMRCGGRGLDGFSVAQRGRTAVDRILGNQLVAGPG